MGLSQLGTRGSEENEDGGGGLMAGKPAPQRSFETCAFLLQLIGSFIIAYLPTFEGLISAWSNSEDYSHGFIILPLSVFIGWQKRGLIARLQPNPTRWGLVLVAAALLLYLVGRLGEITTLAAVSMVPVLAGVIVYLWGGVFLSALRFPLFLTLFMIPVPAQIYSEATIPLQLWVSQASAWLAGLLSIPVYREGNVLSLPHRTLEVVQACSGLRSMMALLTLSVVFGYLTLKSNALRALLAISAVPASILVNIIRVLALILFEYYFSYDLSAGALHTVFGVFIFAQALAAVALTRGILSFWDRSAASR
jgi:exosortase A